MKNNYLQGFIGAFLGGILFTLPWVLLYVYFNFLFSLLGAVIGFGAYKAYKLFGGKDGNRTALIITIASLLAITVATFLIIPLWLIAKEGYGLSFGLLAKLYNNGNFVSGIIRDYIISLVFTLLGISGIIRNIKSIPEKDINGEVKVDPYLLPFEDKLKYLESLYEKYDAFSKEKAVSSFQIMKDMNSKFKIRFLQDFELKGIIVSPLIKSYFDKEAVNDPARAKKNKNKGILVGVLVGLLISLLIFGTAFILIFAFDDDTHDNNKTDYPDFVETTIKEKEYSANNISLMLPESFTEFSSENDMIVYMSNDTKYPINYCGFTKYKIDVNDGVTIDLFKEAYIKQLEDTMTINGSEDLIIGDMRAFKLKTKLKTNDKIQYAIYIAYGDNYIYGIILGANINDTYQELDFNNEVTKVIRTVKIEEKTL